MYKSKNCGELTLKNISEEVLLCGWVQKIRNLGPILFLDLRDQHGITQITFYEDKPSYEKAKKLGREFVIQIRGKVEKRAAINAELPTGEIEILPSELHILNPSDTPPFTIEDNTDGGEEIRMKYRYLDIRRNPIKENLLFRHKVAQETRNFLSNQGFIEVETPILIKSTPEGARDFVVPSRLHKGEFYALPQSPQTFKQLLMVGGIEKYFQLTKCFRDEDLRADRQPEFTQIDCELSFVGQEDILAVFERFISYLLHKIHNIESKPFPRITYEDAMKNYGSDKPDLRFDMPIFEVSELAKGKGFEPFDKNEKVLGICAPASHYSRKQIDELTNWMKRPQIGTFGLVWIKNGEEIKSSVDKFFTKEQLSKILQKANAKKEDMLFLLSGSEKKAFKQAAELRLKLAKDLDLIDPNKFAPLWVTDFPLLEWNENLMRYQALHHPFTRPKQEDLDLLETSPEKVRAQAYDLVINGYEIGGGSIRIHESALQERMFKLLGFSKDEIQNQFGFLIEAFKYGAPPHGGIALGLDRLVMVLAKKENIRDFIAFAKNNLAKDLMSGSPSLLSKSQLDELYLEIKE